MAKQKIDRSVNLRIKGGVKPTGKGVVLSPRTVRKVERKFQIIQMRRDGYSVADIASTLGINSFTVSECLREALQEAISKTNENTEESRQLQLERLDALLKAHMALAINSHKEVRVDRDTGQEIIIELPPDPTEAMLVLKIEERRAKLIALDVPEKKQLEVTGIREYIGIRVEDV